MIDLDIETEEIADLFQPGSITTLEEGSYQYDLLEQVNSIISDTEYFKTNIADIMFPALVQYPEDGINGGQFKFYFFRMNKLAEDAEVYALYTQVQVDKQDVLPIKFMKYECKLIEKTETSESVYGEAYVATFDLFYSFYKIKVDGKQQQFLCLRVDDDSQFDFAVLRKQI